MGFDIFVDKVQKTVDKVFDHLTKTTDAKIDNVKNGILPDVQNTKTAVTNLSNKIGNNSDKNDTTIFGKENAIKDRLFKGFVPYTYYEPTPYVEKEIKLSNQVTCYAGNPSKVIGSFSFSQFENYMISLKMHKNGTSFLQFFISTSSTPVEKDKISKDSNIIYNKSSEVKTSSDEFILTPSSILEKTKNEGLKKNVTYYIHCYSNHTSYTSIWNISDILYIRAFSLKKIADESRIFTVETATSIRFKTQESNYSNFFYGTSIVLPKAYPLKKLDITTSGNKVKTLDMFIDGELICMGISSEGTSETISLQFQVYA